MSLMRWLYLWAFLLLGCAVSLVVGEVMLPWSDLWGVWLGQYTASADVEIAQSILFEIRFPRVLFALTVGAALGLAGAAMQGLLRNPLAEPGIMGISGGAAVVSVAFLYFGIALWQSWLLPLGAVLGSLLSLALVWFIAGRGASITTLILAGVATAAFFSGLVALLLSLAPNPFAMQELSFWLMGSVANRDFTQWFFQVPFIVIGVLLVLTSGSYLQALTLGEETAATLGFHVARSRWQVLIGCALLVGASVAMTGIIGFIGLIVPHILRPWVGADPRALLPASALGGAILLIWADCLVQILPTPQALQVGVILTLLGGPFFLMLILKARLPWRQGA